MSRRYYRDAAKDAAYLAERMRVATREWKVGDACLPFRGSFATTVKRIEGETIYLANGNSGHRSNMREVPAPKRSPRSNFQRGSGTYKCEECGRMTRETGEGESDSKVCHWCYEIYGIENAIADGKYTPEFGAAEIEAVVAERDANKIKL